MEQFDQLLTCCICLDRYRTPKLLPCQHSYCLEPCMEGLVDYVKRQVKCPECRAEHRIPYNGIQGFPTNYTLQKFLELHSEITGELPDPNADAIMSRCNVCSEKAYVSPCAHCDKKVCDVCKEAHCDILKREISRINNQIKRGWHRIEDCLKQVEKNEQQLSTNGSQILIEIEEIKRRLTNALNERTAQLKQSVEKYVTEETQKLKETKSNLELEVTNIQSNADLMEKHLNDDTKWDDNELMDCKDIFIKMMDFIRNYDPGSEEYTRRIRFNVNDAVNDIARKILEMGDLKMQENKAKTTQEEEDYSRSSGFGSGLSRSKSDHRLVTEFRRRSALEDSDKSPPSMRRRFGESRYSREDNRSRTNLGRYGADLDDEDVDMERRGGQSGGRFRSRFLRGGDDEEDYGSSRNNKSYDDEESKLTKKERTKVVDTEDASRGPLSGCIRLADSSRVIQRLKEMEMEKIRPKKVEPPPQPITPKKLQGVFSNTQPVLPTPQTDDEIDRIKRENKAKEAAEAAARAASGAAAAPTSTETTTTAAPEEEYEEYEYEEYDYDEDDENATTPTVVRPAGGGSSYTSTTAATAASTAATPASTAATTAAKTPTTAASSQQQQQQSSSSESEEEEDDDEYEYYDETEEEEPASPAAPAAKPAAPTSQYAAAPPARQAAATSQAYPSLLLSGRGATANASSPSAAAAAAATARAAAATTTPSSQPQNRVTSPPRNLGATTKTQQPSSSIVSAYQQQQQQQQPPAPPVASPRSPVPPVDVEDEINKFTRNYRKPRENTTSFVDKYLAKSSNQTPSGSSSTSSMKQPTSGVAQSSSTASSGYGSTHEDGLRRFGATSQKDSLSARLARSKSSGVVLGSRDDDDEDESSSETDDDDSDERMPFTSKFGGELARSRSSHLLKRGQSVGNSGAAETDGSDSRRDSNASGGSGQGQDSLSSWAKYLKTKYGSRKTNNQQSQNQQQGNSGGQQQNTLARSMSMAPATPHRQQATLTFGGRGSQAGLFTWPRGIAVGLNDSIIVADSSNHRVQVFDSIGGFKFSFGGYGNGDGEFDCLAGVAVNRIGQYIIADRYNHRVQIFDPAGNFIRSFGSQGSQDGKFSYPWGVTTDALGFIYVCDKENHRIQVFQSDGSFVGKFGVAGSQPGQLEHPHYIAVSNTNRVIVSDSNNHRVQIFDINGKVITAFGGEGTEMGQFKFPRGVAVDEKGEIYVADSGNNRIQVFKADGTFVKAFGRWGSGPSEFKGLEGIAVNARGGILIADRENHRVQIF